jgi:hypothetical protein
MRSIIFILALSVLLISCGQNDTKQKEKELELREREIKLKEDELKLKENNLERNTVPKNTNTQTATENISKNEDQKNSISSTKYLYVLIQTLEPKIVTKEKSVQQIDAEIKSGIILPAEKAVKFVNMDRLSEIVEIKNYKEDDKFKTIDNFEKTVLEIQYWIDKEIQNHFANDQTLASIYKCTIRERKCFVFDSYAAASVSLHKH